MSDTLKRMIENNKAADKETKEFVYKILLPLVLIIALFVVAIYWMGYYDGKKEREDSEIRLIKQMGNNSIRRNPI